MNIKTIDFPLFNSELDSDKINLIQSESDIEEDEEEEDEDLSPIIYYNLIIEIRGAFIE